MLAFAMFMVISSTYVVSFIGECGVGTADVYAYMLNNIGDRMPHCGSFELVLYWCFIPE